MTGSSLLSYTTRTAASSVVARPRLPRGRYQPARRDSRSRREAPSCGTWRSLSSSQAQLTGRYHELESAGQHPLGTIRKQILPFLRSSPSITHISSNNRSGRAIAGGFSASALQRLRGERVAPASNSPALQSEFVAEQLLSVLDKRSHDSLLSSKPFEALPSAVRIGVRPGSCKVHSRALSSTMASFSTPTNPLQHSASTRSPLLRPFSTLTPNQTAVNRLQLVASTLGARGEASKMTVQRKHKVSIVGSGNWGSAIAKILAENTAHHPQLFYPEVHMWVYEEKYQLPSSHPKYNPSKHSSPQNLSELINELHENVKYLPNIDFPANLIAEPDLVKAVSDSTLIIFNVPHQFVPNVCKQLSGKILPYAKAVSCIKGVSVSPAEGITLFSEVIGQKLGIYCGALSGANIATEVAKEKFCETTIAYDPHSPLSLGRTTPEPPSDLPPVNHQLWKHLFHRPYFHVRVIEDVAGASLAGALKNVVALAAGFVDGRGWGDNAKAAVMRVGLLEMTRFGLTFFPESCRAETFTAESCGVADLITSCAAGRNHRCAKMAVEQGKTVAQIEKEVMNGQSLQGTLTAFEVHEFLEIQGKEKEFPLFTAVYKILKGEESVDDIPTLMSPY